MERRVTINAPNKIFSITIQPSETIYSFRDRIAQAHPQIFDGEVNDFTFAPLHYQQIVHPDSTFMIDLLQWNHLFQVDLPEVESFDFAHMNKKELETLRTSQIGNFLSSNNGKIQTGPVGGRGDDDDISMTGSTDDDDDDGFDLSKMLSFDPEGPVHPNDTVLKKVIPAQLYLIKKHQHGEAPQSRFEPSRAYHWFRMCNFKVKTFVVYGYEQRFIAAQGYMIYIYKSVAEFLSGKEPLESFHIAGLNIYNTVQREDSGSKYHLCLKSNDLQLHGPSPMAISNAFAQKDKLTNPNQTNPSPSPSAVTSPKSPTAAASGKDEVVFLTPEPLAPNDDLVCGAFRRDNITKPTKGFNVITFDDLLSHQSVYRFLVALKYQWLTEISVNCATICERRGYWTSEGIFRQSASASQLEELKVSLYQGQYVDVSTHLNEHTFSSLMKVLVRELADGPLSTGLYTKWLECIYEHERVEKEVGKDVIAKDPEQAARVTYAFSQGVRAVTKKLPYYINNYLSFLFPLLHHVARFSERSKMHYQQLAIVFAPNLITAPIGRESLQQQMDNQRKINDMVQTIIGSSYQYYSPLGSNNKPLHNVIMYALLEPKLLNSVMDDFPMREKGGTSSPSTNTPQRSPTNSTRQQGSFFTPQVQRSDPMSIGGTLSKDDSAPLAGEPVVKMGYVNTKRYDPSGGLGDLADDDTDSLAGSFYDSNRYVPMPANELGEPIESIGEDAASLPPLPPLPQLQMEREGSVQVLDLTQSQCGGENLNLAVVDEEEKQRYEQERQTMIEQQQRELEQEEMEIYNRVVAEKREQQDRREKMATGLRAIQPFLTNFANDLANPELQFSITDSTESAIYQAIAQLQELSELVAYDRGGA